MRKNRQALLPLLPLLGLLLQLTLALQPVAATRRHPAPVPQCPHLLLRLPPSARNLRRWTAQKALEFTKQRRSLVAPNDGFWRTLCALEGQLGLTERCVPAACCGLACVVDVAMSRRLCHLTQWAAHMLPTPC
jgi:hypothetical protein